MVGKIHAAVEARTDPDILICARTDAAITQGLDEAIARERAYEAAGADALLTPRHHRHPRHEKSN
jgi:2-methylisocitrate lyase-like PEP mutase family enzyme